MSGPTRCTNGSHFVAEGWDEESRGVCPRCGALVSWDERRDLWVEDDDLRVLVLTTDEVSALIPDPYVELTEVQLTIATQISLQQGG
jgi:hypothetical protein